jgi:hypothetical protein
MSGKMDFWWSYPKRNIKHKILLDFNIYQKNVALIHPQFDHVHIQVNEGMFLFINYLLLIYLSYLFMLCTIFVVF